MGYSAVSLYLMEVALMGKRSLECYWLLFLFVKNVKIKKSFFTTAINI